MAIGSDSNSEALRVDQIFVLIPSHNRRDILCATLAMVRAQLPPDRARILIVDAGSTDGTYDAVRTRFPAVDVVRGTADMWWARTVNHGISHMARSAKPGDRVILMNDDVSLHPQALPNLIEASRIEPYSVIGAVNLCRGPNEDLRVYFCGGYYDLHFARHKANIPENLPWREPEKRFFETDFLYGRLLIFPWEVFEKGCRFDAATFPQYTADEDFSYDAKRRGFRLLIDAQSKVFVNKDTTAHFSLAVSKAGFGGIYSALTAHNSCYNLKQGWAFARRYARWPLVFMLCRYSILFLNDNIRRRS